MRMYAMAMAVIVVLTAACSGGDDDDSAASDDFCAEAEEFMLEGEVFSDPTSAAADEALSRAEDLDPPDEIAGDWSRLIVGSRALSELDPAAVAGGDLAPEIEEMGAASTSVYRYLADECGVELSDAGEGPLDGAPEVPSEG